MLADSIGDTAGPVGLPVLVVGDEQQARRALPGCAEGDGVDGVVEFQHFLGLAVAVETDDVALIDGPQGGPEAAVGRVERQAADPQVAEVGERAVAGLKISMPWPEET